MREIFCEDAILWLKNQQFDANSSLIASLPDISEFPSFTLIQWKNWFTQTAKLILESCPDEGVAIFYQSDIKYEGEWVDKGYLVQKAAEELGIPLLWHKIACRVDPGIATFGRPAYSRILCFSKSLKLDPGKSLPDVLPYLGDKTWTRGMGLDACLMIAKFLTEQTKTKKLIHPFCGEGAMIAVANHFGMDAVGIERSPKRAEKARLLTLLKKDKSFEFTSEESSS